MRWERHRSPHAVRCLQVSSSSSQSAFRVTELQNHCGWKSPLRSPAQLSTYHQYCSLTTSLSATSPRFLNTSRDGDFPLVLSLLPGSRGQPPPCQIPILYITLHSVHLSRQRLIQLQSQPAISRGMYFF